MNIKKLVWNIPLWWSQIEINWDTWEVSKTSFNSGKSVKVYAYKASNKRDFLSFNYYETSNKEILKPCEIEMRIIEKFLKLYQ